MRGRPRIVEQIPVKAEIVEVVVGVTEINVPDFCLLKPTLILQVGQQADSENAFG